MATYQVRVNVAMSLRRFRFQTGDHVIFVGLANFHNFHPKSLVVKTQVFDFKLGQVCRGV